MSPLLPQRKSPRLNGYDYSQSGAYFVTICTYRRLHLFGHIQDDQMIFSDLGRVTEAQLTSLSSFWDTVTVDSFVVMPNHVHAIIILENRNNTQPVDSLQHVATLGQIVGNFKAGVPRIARECQLVPDEVENGKIWQSRYHDHIIRDEQALRQIQTYIAENPLRWAKDTFFGLKP